MRTVAMPHSVADLTTGWLSATLSLSTDTVVKVAGLDVEPIGTGQAGATYRLIPTYVGASRDLPQTLVAKLPAEDPALRAGLKLGYRSEIAFYAKVADNVSVPTPGCYYCDINDDGTEFALLLSDLDPAIQGDQIGGCSDRRARLVVEALAGLHGPSWCDPTWLELAEAAMPMPGDDAGAQLMAEAAQSAVEIVLNRLGSDLHAADHETLRSAMRLVQPWMAVQPRFALMHGDFRADNVMFHPTQDLVTVVDWQTIGVGLPARDLAYFTASSLLPTARRATESGLVDHYYAALQQHGVTDYERESCWLDYCIGMMQPALISLLGCAFASPTPRGDQMFVLTLQRSCLAIRELKTLELITANS